MKKFFCIIASLVLLSGIPFAFASELDLGTLSDAELLALHNRTKVEIGVRGIDTSNLIYDGVYVVGKDIKAGQYTYTVVLTSYGVDVITFKTEDLYNSYFSAKRFTVGEENAAIEANAHSKVYLRAAENTTLNLHEGMVLLIKDGSGSLESVTSSWAP